ncbi:hypothetical protein [Pectobacterium odoriferum]|uniref:hypothetical protein n=1 Tax=Pectobacterium odoriferum TaxID=78398 RepID=UPI000CD24662|nr:hypothetical protein [Pectobacterium odoriferum]POD92334.1 hypothetical protein BVY06_19655 [Pectobacterium odoriferum]POE39936.1 hypothetical protein BV920_11150 [Pectobacterium odoriferum]
MFNDSDHQQDSTLGLTEIRKVLDSIQSDLEEAFNSVDSAEAGAGTAWYALDRLHAIAEKADEALRGVTT